MPTTLRHNLTSAYLNAARKLAPRKRRRRIVAYVESYDDVAFWRTLLSEFEALVHQPGQRQENGADEHTEHRGTGP